MEGMLLNTEQTREYLKMKEEYEELKKFKSKYFVLRRGAKLPDNYTEEQLLAIKTEERQAILESLLEMKALHEVIINDTEIQYMIELIIK